MNEHETIISATTFIDEDVCFKLYADNVNHNYAFNA